MSATTERRWTADEVREFPHDRTRRTEVLDGELFVTHAPVTKHQLVVGALFVALDGYARAMRVGVALTAPADVELDPFSLVQPDLFVAPLYDGRPPHSQAEYGMPTLVVEVLSPNTARYDRLRKRIRYQRAGLELWIVDGEARVVERWTSDSARPEILGETLVWHQTGAANPLQLDLVALFTHALGPLADS